MKTSMNKIWAWLAALALSFAFAACCLKLPQLSDALSSLGNINLIGYALTIILFCLLFFLLCGLFCRVKSGRAGGSSRTAWILSLLLTAGSLVFLVRMLILEVNIFGGVSGRYIWHRLPMSAVLLFFTAEVLVFLLYLRKNSLALTDGAWYILYGSLTALIGYTFYTPAVFVRGYSDLLHAHAYYNSIYNILHGAPYSEEATSIYGHYALFYRIPMKLLGGDFIDFILLTAVVGALCFLVMFLALHFLIKDHTLRLLGTAAVTFPVLGMRSGIYWQLWPHRILFMSLILVFSAFCVRFKKLGRTACLIGYVICAAGILWNTESGLFCAVAWAGFWILKSLCADRLRPAPVLGRMLLHGTAVILCFLSAFGTVNIYNLAMHGSTSSVREFLFPLLNASYMTDQLRVDLTTFPSAYMPVIALLFLAVAWGISHMRFFRSGPTESKDAELYPCLAFAAGVLTLGQTSYYMNRAAYHNLDICHLPSVLLICMMAEAGLPFIRGFCIKKIREYEPSLICRGAYTFVSLVVLLAVCTGTVLQFGTNMELRTELHDESGILAFATHIQANIPKDTYAFGIGVPEIYSVLRWDTQCYTLDFSDLSVRPQVAEYVVKDLREREIPAFLTGMQTMEKLARFAPDENRWILQNYSLEAEYEFQGALFRYYVRRES